MRKSNRITKSAIIFIIVLAVALVAGVSFFSQQTPDGQLLSNNNDNNSAGATDIIGKPANMAAFPDGTMLSGQGLLFGENVMETRALAGYGSNGVLSGTGSDHVSSRDFYVGSSTSYTFAPNGLTFNNGEVGSLIRLSTDEAWYGVHSAIKDPNMAVEFQFLGTLENKDTVQRDVTIFINWQANGSSTTQSSMVTKTLLPGGRLAADSVLSNIRNTGLNNNARFSLVIQSIGNITLFNPKVFMSVTMENVVIGHDTTYIISGPNRNTVTLNTSSETYEDDVKENFIKAGDTIRLQTTAHLEGSQDLYRFPKYYLSVFDINNYVGNEDDPFNDNPSGIIWKDSAQSDDQRSYLIKEKEGYYQGTSSEDPSGYFVEFKVNSGVGNEQELYIDPFMYTSYSISGKTTHMPAAMQKRITLKVDSSRPTMPAIDPTSTLGQAIVNQTWYTQTQKPKFTFTATSHDILAVEYIYAFVCPSSVLTLDLDNYDFTPGKKVDAITDSGLSIPRQEIATVSIKGGMLNIAVEECDFGHPGEYTLVLVAVDKAGNVSAPNTYSTFNKNTAVKVDSTQHKVGVEFTLGTAIVASSQRESIARTYIIVGSEHHDENGVLKYSDDVNYSGYYTNAFKNVSGAKRLQWVTIRITMTAAKSLDYQLISYTNSTTLNNENPVFIVPTDVSRVKYLDITFQMTEEFIASDGGIVSYYFRERVDVVVNKANYNFTGSTIDLTQNVEAFQRNTSNLLQDVGFIFKYYKTLTYTVFPNMQGGRPTIGGSILINGREYFDNENDLLLQKQDIKIGNDTYYAIENKLNSPVDGRVNYTVTAFNKALYSTQGYIDAGTYWYQVDIDRVQTVRYFGGKEGLLTINKANPQVTDLKPAYPLVFGAISSQGESGFDLLEFDSLGPNNIRLPHTDIVHFMGRNYYKSFSGTLGIYVVTSPSYGTDIYHNPNVQKSIKITVEFRPIDVTINNNGEPLTPEAIEADWDYYSQYYTRVSEGVFELIPGGKHSKNYNTQILYMDVEILPAIAFIEVSGETTFDYDGMEKEVELNTYTENDSEIELPYLIYYAQMISEGVYGEFRTALPYNAGVYLVKYLINAAECNYYSEEMTAIMTIEKRMLDINLTSSNPTSPNTVPTYTDDGVRYNRYIDFVYGRLASFPIVSGYTLDGEFFDVSVGYEYSYKMVRDIDNRNVNREYSPFVEQIDPRTLDVGTYLVRVWVKNNNNQGYTTILMQINPVMDGSADMRLIFPNLNTDYEVYDIGSSSPRQSGSDRTIGHIEYGQTLGGMADNIMNITAANIAAYLYRGNTERINIGGRFYFEDEEEILRRHGYTTLEYNKYGEIILPVLYDSNSPSSVAAYQVYFYWQAGEVVDGEFVPNRNFDVFRVETIIYVARAKANFDNVKLSDIIFGQRLSEAWFEGLPTASGGFELSADSFELMIKSSPDQILSRGEHSVVCTFVPTSAYIRKYRDLSDVRIPITVLPMSAEISFADTLTHNFGDNYSAPICITQPVAGINVAYSFETLDGLSIVINSSTPVGEYRVTATIIDENYGGQVTVPYFVVKAPLYLYSTPSNPLVKYGEKLSDVRLAEGRVRNSTAAYTYLGNFEFVYEDGITANTIPPVGSTIYKLRFVPNDPAVYDNFEEFIFEYELVVVKSSATIFVDALTQTYNGTALSPEYGAFRPDGSALNVVMTFANGTAPINAGEYGVSFNIVDENYEGTIERVFTIAKAHVNLVPENNNKIYNTQPQAVSYTASQTGLRYIIQYTDYQGFGLSGAPTQVGKYTAIITVSEDNYEGSQSMEMNILPSGMMMENLHQVYGELVPVVARFTPDINYSVKYKYQSGASQYADTPTIAGVYNIRVIINHNGYYEEIDEYDNGEPIILTVDKATTIINASSVYNKIYSSRSHDLDISASHAGIRLIYSYREAGTPEFVSEAPINAGTYTVRVVADDINYKGEAETTLIISPSNLEIRETPIITSINYYSLSASNVTFTGGYVIFPATGSDITANGSWSISTPDSQYMLLPVGVHTVNVKFSPADARNFNAVEGRINISINKLDIGSYIAFVESDLVQEYNQLQLAVRVYLDNDSFANDYGSGIVNINNIVLRVTYNNSQTRPQEVGEYRVSANIEDSNYTGRSQERIMRINKTDPVIILPKLSSISVGESLSMSAISGGGAYIKKNNPNEETRTIAGTFRFLHPSTIMNEANYHKVWVEFTPNDQQNYNTANFQMDIFVIGQSVEILNVSATGITYGMPLSASELDYEWASVPGTLEWVNPSDIVNVGDRASYIFVPDDISVYNIQEGNIDISVEKAALSHDNLVAKAYVGEAMRNARISFDLYHSDYVGDSRWLVSGYTLTLSNDPSLDNIVREAGDEFALNIIIRHRNYQDTEFSIIVRTYNLLKSDSFIIGSSEKYFDNKPVGIADFDITLSDTDYAITDNIIIQKIMLNGVQTDSILNVGRYEITISITDENYDGSATFIYEIKKFDISDAIKLPNGSNEIHTTYGDPDRRIEWEFWQIIGDERVDYAVDYQYIRLEYLSADESISYAGISPKNAGSYKIKISISSQNKEYMGSATFGYIVDKKLASIRLDSTYSFIFGQTFEIIPSLDITGASYVVRYNNSVSKPINAGTYTVVASIVHANYYGDSNESELRISRAPITIKNYPTLSSIQYGQALKNASINGGSAEYGSAGIPIPGTFSFVNPDRVEFMVGVSSVDVKFSPTDKNYAEYQFSLPITVRKASASIEIKSATATFTGQRLSPSVATQPVDKLTINYVFLQNGIEVEPINAGEYLVRMTIIHDNYDGYAETMFTIKKVEMYSIIIPTASTVAYGQSLIHSTLMGGAIKYFADRPDTAGRFEYVNDGLILGNAGESYTVDYRFVPNDTTNYEIYYSTVEVTVVKADVVIKVENNEFVYGNTLTNPVFITDPKDLRIDNTEFLTSELVNNVAEQVVGAYEFNAWVDDQNYQGEITYIISITKKDLRVHFVNASGMDVERYSAEYKNTINAKVRIDQSSVVGRDIQNIAEIEKSILYTYKLKGVENAPLSHVPPKNVGTYVVYASTISKNYNIQATIATVDYIINRARITNVEFVAESLNQEYGNVNAPIIRITPSDVKYRVVYDGVEFLPSAVGTYSLKVIITDDNYNPLGKDVGSHFRISPKKITIENIKVSNKSFDGSSNISITGELKGIKVGDEVSLKMTARAKNGATEIGNYDVEILTWEIFGQHAANYSVQPPLYNGKVKITSKVITDTITGSYITSANGFSSNITVDFSEVYVTQNKTNIFTALFGQKAKVHRIAVKENGIDMVLNEKVKFYVKIPDEFKNSKNFIVEPLGELGNINIKPIIEGDYITFYADRSGEIVLYSNDFPYWTIIAVSILLILVVGGLFMIIFMPVRRRYKVNRRIARAYNQQQGNQLRK